MDIKEIIHELEYVKAHNVVHTISYGEVVIRFEYFKEDKHWHVGLGVKGFTMCVSFDDFKLWEGKEGITLYNKGVPIGFI